MSANTLAPGRIVQYILSDRDVNLISNWRGRGLPDGLTIRQGNPVRIGDIVPLIVVKVWPDEFGEGQPGVNGQAILDGNDSYWVTSAKEGDEPGSYHWPERS